MPSSVEQMVRFREGGDTIIVIPVTPLEEKENMWYSRNELPQFEHDALLEDLLAKRSKMATVDDLLAVRCKKLMEQMRKEMSDLKTYEQLNLNTLRSELLKEGMKGSHNDKPENIPHVGWSRDPPSPGYSPNSVCHDLYSAEELPRSTHKPSIVNHSLSLPPPPIFGPSSSSKDKTPHQTIVSYEVPLKRHPLRTRHRIPPPINPQGTWKSWRKSDSYLQSRSRNQPTYSAEHVQKQCMTLSTLTPPRALSHRRKSGGSNVVCEDSQRFKRSFTEPRAPAPSTLANMTASTSTKSEISELAIKDHGWSVP